MRPSGAEYRIKSEKRLIWQAYERESRLGKVLSAERAAAARC